MSAENGKKIVLGIGAYLILKSVLNLIFHSKCGLFDFVCCICRSAGDANSLYFVYSSRLFGYCIPNEHRKQSCQYRQQLDLPGGRLVGCWMCGTAGVAKGCPRLFQIRTFL